MKYFYGIASTRSTTMRLATISISISISIAIAMSTGLLLIGCTSSGDLALDSTEKPSLETVTKSRSSVNVVNNGVYSTKLEAEASKGNTITQKVVARHSLKNKKIYASDIKEAMNKYIKANTKNGVYSIDDIKTTDHLRLEFVKIHDPVRVIDGRGYFACTDFHPEGTVNGKLYDLDFWLNVNDRGELKVTEVAIHKHPEMKDSKKWQKVARYTFINDRPVAVRQ